MSVRGGFVTEGKGKVFKMVVRPAMRYGLEMVSLTKRQKVVLKMLRLSLGVTRMYKIRNESYRRGIVEK